MGGLAQWVVLGIGLWIVQTVVCANSDLKCKVDVPGSTLQPCKVLSDCSVNHDLCKSTVLIAVKNADDSFTVKAMGVAVSPKHFLTSVLSDFKKYGDEELYIIYKGKNVVPLRNQQLYPRFILARPDVKAWADFVLVELSEKSSLSFDPVPIASVGAKLPTAPLTFVSDKQDTLSLNVQFTFLPDADCATLFRHDVMKIDPKYTVCASDKNSKFTKFLTGAPVVAKVFRQRGYVLYGLRSVTPVGVPDSKDYLVTRLGQHCDWFESVTNGVIKCKLTN
uniref:Peptidase S1 domain-containing protein n=1 Tax=Panagrellus redivivus TaxID=6233 RepID=A0A7E4ZVB7_PANRE